MVELIRLSGYRLNRDFKERKLTQEQLAYKWAALRTEVQKYVPLFQQMDTGFYLDDGDKVLAPLDLLMGKLQNGEIYIVHSKGEFVGVAAITDIAYGRNAYIEGIASSKYHGTVEVGKAIGELLTYAFNDYEDNGLGLKKLKATVVSDNMRAIKKAGKVGFNPAGILKGESLHMGVPHDMILMELLNPKFFSVDTKVISNEQRPISTSDSLHELREPATVTASTVSDGERSVSTDSSTDRTGGAELRVDTATVAPAEQLQWDQESFESGRPGWTLRPTTNATDAELVHTESSPTATEPNTSPESDSGRRVRKQSSSSSRAVRSRRTTASIPSGISS